MGIEIVFHGFQVGRFDQKAKPVKEGVGQGDLHLGVNAQQLADQALIGLVDLLDGHIFGIAEHLVHLGIGLAGAAVQGHGEGDGSAEGRQHHIAGLFSGGPREQLNAKLVAAADHFTGPFGQFNDDRFGHRRRIIVLFTSRKPAHQ